MSHTEVVCGPSELISVEEAKAAVSAMTAGKAAGPSGVVSEMIKAAGGAGVGWMTNLFSRVVVEGKVPDGWRGGLVVAVCRGRGDALDCGSYRGIKLLDHAMKVFERIIEKRLRAKVNLDDMHFGFRPSRGTQMLSS